MIEFASAWTATQRNLRRERVRRDHVTAAACQRVSRLRVAAAGAFAAAVWTAQEPLDRRVFGHPYSDPMFLGKAITRGRGWRVAGVTWHLANGALFALAVDTLARRTGRDPRRLALQLALAENTVLYPVTILTDRYHPARDDPGVAPLWHPRAFAQATWRHALFGWLVGRLASAERHA